jgi:hypothetical protein
MTTNSDAVFAVRFYAKEQEIPFQTALEGRPIFEMRDFVRIEVPGNQLSIIDTLANEDHKRRFPIQWAAYQNTKGGEQIMPGTPLKDWALLNSAQAKELEHYRFYTVEQVANASDHNLQSIGMLAGMSPISFREKARAYLSSAKGSALVMQQADELAQSRAREQATREAMAEMQSQLEALTAKIEGREEKRKPGRPRQEQQAA